MIGTRLSRHTVKIPTHLLAVADPETRARLHATFMLVPPGDELSGEAIDQQRKLLEAQFVREIPTFGAVILRRDKEAFEKGRQQLVAAFGEQVRMKVKVAIENNRQHLKHPCCRD